MSALAQTISYNVSDSAILQGKVARPGSREVFQQYLPFRKLTCVVSESPTSGHTIAKPSAVRRDYRAALDATALSIVSAWRVTRD
jgi:hypothetical protein